MEGEKERKREGEREMCIVVITIYGEDGKAQTESSRVSLTSATFPLTKIYDDDEAKAVMKK